MPKTIISDTSCLILLEKIAELELLNNVFGNILVTQEIANEYGLKLPFWISVQNPQNQNYQRLLEAKVDTGEASAIALAFEVGNALLIIDDLKGRNLAEELGINYTGTLGVLIEAKRLGILTSVVPILAKIKKTDFQISEDLERRVLSLSGENAI